MTLTKHDQMILLIDVTMDMAAIPLAAIFEKVPAQYDLFRDNCIARIIERSDPVVDISAERAAEYMDEKVADVIRRKATNSLH